MENTFENKISAEFIWKFYLLLCQLYIIVFVAHCRPCQICECVCSSSLFRFLNPEVSHVILTVVHHLHTTV